MPLAALAGLVFTAIAIYVAVGYTPNSSTEPADPAVTQTISPTPSAPAPPCEGVTAGGCEQLLPAR